MQDDLSTSTTGASGGAKVALITGASRGIGAETAVALAAAGFRVAITARTLQGGEQQNYAGQAIALPGSLAATAAAIERLGAEVLCLQGDILDEASMLAVVDQVLAEWGRIDLLFNNAVYQGPGNQSPVVEVSREQLDAIYQGNLFTPLALVKACLPSMLQNGGGLILNMLSHTAFNDPMATAANGGWSFAYPSSKAALGRLAGALRVEHPDSGLRVYNIEPGLVVSEMMRAAGIDEAVLAHFKPCSPQAVAAVVAWLSDNEPSASWEPEKLLRAPAIAKELGFLKLPSLLEGEK